MRKKNARCLVGVMSCLVLAAAWGSLAFPGASIAKKPQAEVFGEAAFVAAGAFGSEIVSVVPFEGSSVEKNYRTNFVTGSVVVTAKLNQDGTGHVTAVLDQRMFLAKLIDSTGERIVGFAVGVKDGHHKKDRYTTPDIPFPEDVWYSNGGIVPNPYPGAPSLEVVEGQVDANLDMLPGAHVILHINESGVPLIGQSGPNQGNVIGYVSIGDIEFTFPPDP